jgi:lipoyl(octanoyl) transferase
MTPNRCAVILLGMIEYRQAWKLQEDLSAEIASGQRLPTLLLLEHPHTYTFGRRGRIEHLLWDEAELERRGISTHWVDRGGDVTYHGPGQMVGYPLLPLAISGLFRREADSGHIPQADYVGYIRRLEQALILTLEAFNLKAFQVEDLTGVWVEAQLGPPEKIASIGVKVDARGITRHGFALNVDPDMSCWEGIISCGIRDRAMTSLAQQLEAVPSMEQVMQVFTASFGEVFAYGMVDERIGELVDSG